MPGMQLMQRANGMWCNGANYIITNTMNTR